MHVCFKGQNESCTELQNGSEFGPSEGEFDIGPVFKGGVVLAETLSDCFPALDQARFRRTGGSCSRDFVCAPWEGRTDQFQIRKSADRFRALGAEANLGLPS